MTINEIRLVKHLVESAHAIAQDDRGAAVLGTYEGFECVMWPDDADLKKWRVTRKQFRRCCAAAFAELKQSEITREKLIHRPEDVALSPLATAIMAWAEREPITLSQATMVAKRFGVAIEEILRGREVVDQR